MTTQLTLSEVLEKAIDKEIEAQHLYTDLSERVFDAAARDACRDLARQEKGHQVFLERYQRGELKEGALSHGQAVDYKVAEQLDQPEIAAEMSLPDIFLLAASREKAAHEFYLGLAQIHPAGEVRELISQLAEQEQAHKQRVESLYTQVAFPQTDGG
jgi:rubrerythrin